MIASIEQAIRQRFSDGLGQMVTSVFIYGGELDNGGSAQAVNQFPTVWVIFAGIKDIVRHGMRGSRFKAIGQFTVSVGDRASGSEADSRLSGLHRRGVGTYRLMQTVRHLPTNQSLGLQIGRLQPGAAKSLFSRQMEQDAVSVFAPEFETYWFEDVLRDGDWPRPAVSDGQQAKVYVDVSEYRGRTGPEHPDSKDVNLELRIPPKNLDQPVDMATTVETKVKP